MLEARSFRNFRRDLCRQCGDSEVLMLEEAEACFVLPLREAAAHFAYRNARSAEAEVGGSNDGNTAAVDASLEIVNLSLEGIWTNNSNSGIENSTI
jgi:hypothetical protein